MWGNHCTPPSGHNKDGARILSEWRSDTPKQATYKRWVKFLKTLLIIQRDRLLWPMHQGRRTWLPLKTGLPTPGLSHVVLRNKGAASRACCPTRTS